MEKTQLIQTVKSVLLEEAKAHFNDSAISDSGLLKAPLAAMDSLSFIHIVVALEAKLDQQFDDQMLMNTNFATVNDLVDYIHNYSSEETVA